KVNNGAYDLIVVSLDVTGVKGFDMIDELRERPELAKAPLIVYSERELSKKEEVHLKRLTQTSVVKDVRSHERLVDEVALFLHRRVDALPEDRRRMLQRLHRADSVLAGKKVL